MGYMYSEMDCAKKKIKDAFQGVEASYKPLWEFDTQNHVTLPPEGDGGKDGGPLIDLEIPLLDDDAFNELLNYPPSGNQNAGKHDDHDVNGLL
ncbi:hypothetical protein PIB30_098065 [Stylosanthes scabra]|uniref:Uncharacterized protein n=1 Tax=Stylosanthes scabra TaxID=79078 RepID=A0ABU6WWE6_9FABA|nr:hypothetical protein [Stylosanthes scabra]